MKVKFKHLLNGYTGVVDDSVVYYMPCIGRCVVRKRPRRHENESQSSFRDITRNIWKLHASELYRQDLREYCHLYKEEKRQELGKCITWNNVYLKLMFTMQRYIPGIDLSTLTRLQIYDQNLPCISVKTAVESGFLPPVHGWTELGAEL